MNSAFALDQEDGAIGLRHKLGIEGFPQTMRRPERDSVERTFASRVSGWTDGSLAEGPYALTSLTAGCERVSVVAHRLRPPGPSKAEIAVVASA